MRSMLGTQRRRATRARASPATAATLALAAPDDDARRRDSACGAKRDEAGICAVRQLPGRNAEDLPIATTSAANFKLDLKTTKIDHPVVLQGGLPSEAFGDQSLIAPTSGETLSKVPQEVPGGLTGLSEAIGGPVTATAELARSQ